MKRMKKFLAVLLAAVMVMAMGSVSVFAGTLTVTVNGSSNGSVKADPTTDLDEHDTVTLTITPDSGYVLDTLSVVYGSSSPVTVSGTGLTRTFEMPDSNVTVTATFKTADYSITVTNSSAADGETYSAYKIFDVTTNGSGGYSYTISTSNPFYTTIADLTSYFTLTAVAGDNTTYVVTVLDAAKDSDGYLVDAVLEKLAEVNLSSASANGTATLSNGSATIGLAEQGYYYVTTSTGSAVIINTVESKKTIADKNTAPSTTKTVYDDSTYTTAESGNDNDSDAAIGDTVYYLTKIENIDDVDKLVLHDEMSSGLTLLNTTSNPITAILYYKTNATDAYSTYTLTADTDYELSTSEMSDDCDFEIDFAKLLAGSSSITLNEYSYIEVKYSATVNENAVIYEPGTDGNTNETYVSYGNASSSTKSKTITYVYSMNIFKYTGDLDGTYTALEDAKFVIKNSNNKYATFSVSNGVYTLTGWVDSIGGATVLTTPSTGLLQISGLDADTVYYIHETEAPAGYNLLSSDISFIIEGSDPSGMQGTVTYNKSGSGTAAAITTSTTPVTVGSTSYASVPVQNNTGSTIPVTGGMGTTILYIIGAILVIGAAVILVTRRRMANK